MFHTLNFKKYIQANVGGIAYHNERQRGNSSYSNKEIDVERTKFNYNFAGFFNKIPTEKEWKKTDYIKKAKKILEFHGISMEKYNNGRKRRKDAPLVVEFVVGASAEFWGDDWKNSNNPRDFLANKLRYFQDAAIYLSQKIGVENVISAVVHLDETNPHMHITFVPLVNVDGRKELSAKDFIGGKKDLQKLHTDFHENVGKKYGLKRGVLNSPNNENYVDLKNFKAKKQKENERLIKNLDKKIALNKEREQVIDEAMEKNEKKLQKSIDFLSKADEMLLEKDMEIAELTRVARELKEKNDERARQNQDLIYFIDNGEPNEVLSMLEEAKNSVLERKNAAKKHKFSR